MLSERELSAAIGTPAYGTDGDKIGTVEHFFVDDLTGQPTWVAVSTGLFGTRSSVAPAQDATFVDGALRLAVTKDAVKEAPAMAGNHLDPGEEATLRQHYGLAGSTPVDGTGDARGERTAPDGTTAEGMPLGAAAPPPAPATDATQVMQAPPPPVPPAEEGTASLRQEAWSDSPDGSMVRSEERLRVGTERVATTRVRLVKYVVTEDVQITVPIRREEIRVEEVPIDAPDDAAEQPPGETLVPDADQRPGGVPAASNSLPDEIILHTERPVVTVEVVPVERVRLRTELVEGSETVTGQVQREQIAVDRTPPPVTPPAPPR